MMLSPKVGQWRFFLALFCLVLTGCTPGEQGKIASVTVNPPAAKVKVGETVEFTAKATDGTGAPVADVVFIWDSSHPDVATVDTEGLATAKAQGSTAITARSGGISGTADLQVVAQEGDTFTLTVTVAGSGTVTSSPAGINCGTDCSEAYNSGTVVTLTAAPNSSYVFNGWGGDCSGTATTCIVTMNADKSATANFVKAPVQTFPLSVTVLGSGTVTSSPTGITCGTDCSEAYPSGTAVTLTATANTGSTFSGWSAPCTGTGACSVTMTANQSVTATFTFILPSAPIGVSAAAGNGQVTVSWSPVSGATSYTLYMATQTGVTKANYTTLTGNMQHPNVTSPYVHTGLINGTTYYFVVTATNAGGESAESAQVSATPILAATFGAATNFPVGASPFSVAIGDVNADGKPDLAVTNSDSNTVSILLGTGTGSFGAATDFSVGAAPLSVAIGDFNADFKPDLAVANQNSNNVSVLLGTGTGSFGAATNFPVGSYPISVAIGDVNADGKPDLAVANYNSSNVSTLLGTGTGSFGTATNFSVGTNPYSVAIGDLNADGKPDLAVANYSSSTVSILLGSGTGSFGAATDFSVESGPRSIAIGDFNLDGKPDLAVANVGSGTVSILLGSGTGSFGAATDFSVGSGPRSIAIGDFNIDGKPDLAVANRDSDNVSILLNTTQGLWVKLISLTSPVSPGDIATMTVETTANADCSITVVYKSGPSQAQGLEPKTADSQGRVSWAWLVGTQTTPGTWPITVTCSAGGQEGTLQTSFVVE